MQSFLYNVWTATNVGNFFFLCLNERVLKIGISGFILYQWTLDFCYTVIMVVAELQCNGLKKLPYELRKQWNSIYYVNCCCCWIDLYQKFVIRSSSYHFSNIASRNTCTLIQVIFFPFSLKYVHLIQKLGCHAKALALFTSWSCDLILIVTWHHLVKN